MTSIRQRLSAAASPKGWRAFVSGVGRNARLLDVGCGNNSPYRLKSQRPDVYYIGLDIGDYNQTAPMLADRYIVTSPDEFASAIEGLKGSLDAVISSHNLEHCFDPDRVVRAMAGALKPGGLLFLAFPSEASTGFPSRGGCLNFFDDKTHRAPPNLTKVLAGLKEAGCEVIVQEPRYQPVLLRMVGALLEPWSRWRGHITIGTWALYGFESILWARKQPSA